jgi:hypothetical protein
METRTAPPLWDAGTVAVILGTTSRMLASWADQELWLFPGTVVRSGSGWQKYRADLIEAAFPAQVAAWREQASA